MRLSHPLWHARPVVLAIMATIGAAGLVLYFQYRAIATLESQTQVIARQIGEQAAAEIAGELHRALAGPVLETLTAVSQPDLRAGRIDLVARNTRKASRRIHTSIDSSRGASVTESTTPGEVLFFGRDGRFVRDPALGRAVFELARRHAPAQHIYIAAEAIGPGQRHHVLLRVFWNDALRRDYFAVLGFVVDPHTMPARLFAEPRGARIKAVLNRARRIAAPSPGARRSGRAHLRQRRRRDHQRPPHLPDAVLSG